MILGILQVGSADHHIHYYDLRNISQPLYVFRGHRKTVSYVKFLSSDELASSSTDSTLRLWDVKENIAVSYGPLQEKRIQSSTYYLYFDCFLWNCDCICDTGYHFRFLSMELPNYLDPLFFQLRTFRGHTNERNFVGLTVNSEYIACGSETNEVFVYHKVREHLNKLVPLASKSFNNIVLTTIAGHL